MTESNAWEVAKEKVAREAMQRIRMGGMPGFAQTVGEDILRLPEPSAFRAAVEAEMGEVVEMLEAVCSFAKALGAAEKDVPIAKARALLSRIGEGNP